MKRYPTAEGLSSVSLLNALKVKAEGDQPVSATVDSDALKGDMQDAHEGQVLNWPLACTPSTCENQMLGELAQCLDLFQASVSHCFEAYNSYKHSDRSDDIICAIFVRHSLDFNA